MSLINSQILPFHANAFRDGELVEVSQDDIAGKWAIFFFYPADFTFVCPTELEDLAEANGLKLDGASRAGMVYFCTLTKKSAIREAGK